MLSELKKIIIPDSALRESKKVFARKTIFQLEPFGQENCGYEIANIFASFYLTHRDPIKGIQVCLKKNYLE